MPRSPKWSLLSNFPIKILHAFLTSLVHCVLPAYLILFDLTTLVIYVEEHTFLNVLIIQFPPASFTSFLLGSKILSTLFSEASNLYSSLRIKETGILYVNRTPDRQLMSHVFSLEDVITLQRAAVGVLQMTRGICPLKSIVKMNPRALRCTRKTWTRRCNGGDDTAS
jgi:hypothetical protein